MSNRNDGPHGVGGWLALLVAGMLVLGPLLGIGRTYGEFASAERQYPALAQVAEWSSFKTVEWVALLIFCAISIYGGLGLATKRTPDAVSRAKLVLWFNYPISIVVTAMIIPATMIPDSGKETAMVIPSLLASLIAVAIWTAYLNRSKRVRNTYGLSDESPIVQVPTTAHQVSSTTNLASIVPATTDGAQHASPLTPSGHTNKAILATDYQATFDEDRVYRQIAEELETGATDKGLWTRLFAECGGDEKQTKVFYIKQRADRLVSAERQRLEQAAREMAAEAKEIEELRLRNLSLKERLMEGNITKELSDKLFALSNTHAAVMMLNKVRLNQLEAVGAMLEEEPLLVAVANSDGDTPLHIAVREKYESMVRLLLKSGARVEVKNRYDVTPLEYANNSRQLEMARLLTSVVS